MTDLLQDALVAKERGDSALAKQLISQALIQQPNNEAAWMLMADIVEDVRLRRNCLERVLAINPDNSAASLILARLNTSPLAPISRGERDKPLNPPRLEKVPPFTPPFTWEGEQEQFLALGDLTYSDLPGKDSDQPANVIPTFDWANESDEPDKTIQKIFDAVSNPEMASQPLPDTDLNWSDFGNQDSDTGQVTATEGEYEARLLDQLVGKDEEQPTQEPVDENPADFTVSAEPELGLEAFTSTDKSLEAVTADYRLWDNPQAKFDRMVILSNKSLVYANPKESDVPHILGLFAENRMLRDLLGENAGKIKLESIQRLTALPGQLRLTIEYKEKEDKTSKKLSRHELEFSTPGVLEEVQDALLIRLGPGFTRSIRTHSLADKIVSPIITLLLVAFIGWGLIYGLGLLDGVSPSLPIFLQDIITGLQGLVSSIGAFNIFLVILLILVVIVIWMLNNLRLPARQVIIER